jgi:hypothetical protein
MNDAVPAIFSADAQVSMTARNLGNLGNQLERLNDRAFPGREAAVRNEAMRLVWRRLQRMDAGPRRAPPSSAAAMSKAGVQPLRLLPLRAPADRFSLGCHARSQPRSRPHPSMEVVVQSSVLATTGQASTAELPALRPMPRSGQDVAGDDRGSSSAAQRQLQCVRARAFAFALSRLPSRRLGDRQARLQPRGRRRRLSDRSKASVQRAMLAWGTP